MSDNYNIYFAGELLPGHDGTEVRGRLAKLFNANDATLDKLFSGRRQLIKRDCDKATALKYKQAMEKAGAVPVITRSGEATAAPTEPTPEPAARPPESASAADRIAAVAAGRDPDQPDADPAMHLEPAGADVLRPEERRTEQPADIDTSSLSLDATGARLSEEAPPPPQAPDTSHMSMGEVGDTIPNLDCGEIPPEPDTAAISLTPEGTDFSDCAPPDADSLDLDLSAIELAPEGSDVLEEEFRKKDNAAAPATDHLSLQD
jgi:hypothetical protein